MDDDVTWLRCGKCGYETVEEKAEICERCGKTFCQVCWQHSGYIDLAGDYWGNGTGYVCEKCVPTHVIDTECPGITSRK